MPASDPKASVTPERVDGRRGKPATAQLIEHQWKPGQSGNPLGRGLRKTPLTDALRKEIEKEIPGADGQTVAVGIAKRLLQIAVGGNASNALEAIQVIFDRMEGKVLQRNELSTPDGRGLHFDSPTSREDAEKRLLDLLQVARDRRRELASEESNEQPRQIEAVIEAPTSRPAPLLPINVARKEKPLDTSW